MIHADYIFAGSGLSGFSLALELANRPFFKGKKIVLIDRDDKSQNDRTWCFWAKPDETIPPVGHKIWDQCLFFGKDVAKTLEIAPYQYHMVRGLDYYTWAKERLSRNPYIHRVTANILEIDAMNGTVKTDAGDFQGEWIFNSAFYPKVGMPLTGKPVDGGRWVADRVKVASNKFKVASDETEVPSADLVKWNKPETFLLQHFKGWKIETEQPSFDPKAVTFMDYRLEQHGETRFVYVLPFTETSALVEFTVFSEKLCPDETYDAELRRYLETVLNIKAFQIKEVEFGVIPMTDLPLTPKGEGKVIHIGTAGGFVKASSGYAFLRTQRKTRAFAAAWEQTGQPDATILSSSRGFKMLDSIMLRVLREGAVSGKDFFSLLFKKLPASLVFRFLDEDASLKDVFRVLSAPPTWPFFRIAVLQLPLLSRIFRNG
jgi:lycopene beta-cyclase